MERQLTEALREATMAMRAAIRAAVGDLGLTPVQSTVLHLVDDAPGSSSAELARRTHVTPQTMHKLVTELEQRELLTLQARPGHGRIRDAHLTDQGRSLVAAADARTQAIEDRMTAGLSPKQRQQLIDLLEHCTTALAVHDDQQPQ